MRAFHVYGAFSQKQIFFIIFFIFVTERTFMQRCWERKENIEAWAVGWHKEQENELEKDNKWEFSNKAKTKKCGMFW